MLYYKRFVLVVIVLIGVVYPHNAYAYLDPGSGSYILQLAIAALMGGIYGIALLRNKIKSFFKKLFARKKQP